MSMSRKNAPHNQHERGIKLAGLALLLGLCLGLLMFAPASWLARAVGLASHGQVLMPNARGTIWHGRSDLVLSSGPGGASASGLPQGVEWSFRTSWSADRPALGLRLHMPCCTPEGMQWHLTWKNGVQLSLAAHRSHWPMQWLTGLGTPWNTLDLDGRLLLDTPGLLVVWANGHAQIGGSLDVQAKDLSTRLSTLRPLGSYQVRIAPDSSGNALLQLNTLSSALTLTGEGEWVQGRFRFRGLAEAQPTNVDALSNLLNILGRRDGTRAHMSLG